MVKVRVRSEEETLPVLPVGISTLMLVGRPVRFSDLY